VHSPKAYELLNVTHYQVLMLIAILEMKSLGLCVWNSICLTNLLKMIQQPKKQIFI